MSGSVLSVHWKVIWFTSSKLISMFSSRGCMAGLLEFKFALRADSKRPVSSQLLGFGSSSVTESVFSAGFFAS
jgi:hypothetical protein